MFSNTMHHGVIHSSISDHSMIFCVVKSGVTKAPGKTIEYRSFKNYSKEDFVNDLKDVDRESVETRKISTLLSPHGTNCLLILLIDMPL